MPAILEELAEMFRGWGGDVRDAEPAGAAGVAGARSLDRAGSLAGDVALNETDASFHDAALGDAAIAAKTAPLADDAAFNRFAMRIHAAQRATNPLLRRFWDAAPGGTPADWDDIPPVAATAFRDLPIVSGTPEVVFRTSGTTGGSGGRGEHHVLSLDLYKAAARANYRRHLMHGAARLRVLSLIPGPRDVPDSSLSTMAGFIAAEPEISNAVWAFHPEEGVYTEAVRELATAGDPVLVLTTAFALVHLLDALGRERIQFPEASRMMETGGFKGRMAEVDRDTLYRRAEHILDIPPSCIVNEYGMTELLSQAYDGVAGTAPPLPTRVHRFPPWVRTRALDPATLAPLPPGEPGLLAHFDLANAGSVCHILTEDFGHTTDDGGLRLLGRAAGASPRGCSLAAESFLRAIRWPR